MSNKNVIDEINAKVSEILQHSPAKDIEKGIKLLLSGAFSRLDLTTRDEFDVQQEVLQRTREKLILLEARVSELEARLNQTIRQSNEQAAASLHTHEEPGREGNLNQC